MNTLFILNGPPYGTEHTYNGLRLAGSLAKREGESVRVFLMGDAVGAGVDGQKLPDGYYHLDRMVKAVLNRGGEVGCCGSCLDARGIDETRLVSGARRSTLEELTDWTVSANRVITF